MTTDSIADSNTSSSPLDAVPNVGYKTSDSRKQTERGIGLAGDTDGQIHLNSETNPLRTPAYCQKFSTSEATEEDKALIRLLSFLESANCSRYVFDGILCWIEDTHIRCGDKFFRKKHKRRERFMEPLWKRINYPKPSKYLVPLEYPRQKDVVIPPSEKSIHTIVFDLVHQLQRVLQNPNRTSKEKTVMDDDDPYGPYKPNELITNVQDGLVFQKTQERHASEPNTMVIGLIAYIDKTHATQNGKYTAEPVVVVPSFFTASEQQNPDNQIILGLVCDMERKSSAVKKKLDKGAPCRNYHAQLRSIHQALSEIHKRGGLWMELNFHGLKKVMKVALPLIVITGDAKSQDNLAG